MRFRFRSPRGVKDVADGRRGAPDSGSRGQSRDRGRTVRVPVDLAPAHAAVTSGAEPRRGHPASPASPAAAVRAKDWSRRPTEQGPRPWTRSGTTARRSPRRSPAASSTVASARQLKGLPDKLALRVARHLAAAGVLIDSDPETAYQHTLAARARASRLAVVREATGEAAYAAGHYAEALAELRAAKRMNGATDYLPIMADCQRALGQPEQALKLAKSPAVANFSSAAKAEMTLVEAGARRDMGQLDAALRTLELAPCSRRAASRGWSACATPTPTPWSRPAARPRRWPGSTAPTPWTPRSSPTPPTAPRSWRSASTDGSPGGAAGVSPSHRSQCLHNYTPVTRSLHRSLSPLGKASLRCR